MPVSGHEQEQDNSEQGNPGGGAPSTVAEDASDGRLAGADAAQAAGADAGEPVVEIDERRAKMERLRAEGIDPYPHVRLPDRTKISDVLAAHDPAELSKGEHEELPYHLAGRLISRRGHGKTAFLDLRD